MLDSERTKNIYEEISGYSKPPMVPLPEPGELTSLEDISLKPGGFSHSMVKLALIATGFNRFYKQFPHRAEDLLRNCDLRGGFLFAPVISATLTLEDDPREMTPVSRATTLLMGAYSLYEDIIAAKLEPDQYRGQILEMGQYPNIFSTCLIMDGRQPRIFKSTNTSRIIVALNGQLFVLNIGESDSNTAARSVEQALSELVDQAERQTMDDDPKPGILTCATHATQRKIFYRLQKIKVNRESLYTLRHSFLTLCFDLEFEPSSHAEAALIAHSRNCENRWYQSSLQIVVFGNAKACTICNFSTYVDGNTMMRASAEIQKRAASVSVSEDNATPTTVRLATPVKLNWKIDTRFIDRAQKELDSILDHQQATFEISDIGRNAFSAHGWEAVPIFILALQMTAKKFTNKMIQIRQFLTMSKYRCMGLADAMVTTPEVIQFVNFMESSTVKFDQAIRLMNEAIESHKTACRHARRYLSLDAIFGLYIISNKGARRIYILLTTALMLIIMQLLRLFNPLRQREVIVSHPEIYKEIPVVGRPGIRLPYVKYFGLHYQILSDRIVVTMMPSVKWTVSNAEFITELEKNLKRIHLIVQGK